MPLYQYATASGSLKTVEASSPQEAMSKAPDRAPRSGVMEVKDQKPERTLPTMDETGRADLPQDTATAPGRIANLTDALTKAVELGRAKRNRLLTGVVSKSFGGTLRGGDFGSVLDAAGKVSERTFSTILDTYNTSLETDDEILSVSDAKALGVPYGTTRAQAAAMGLTPGNDEEEVDQFTDGQKVVVKQAGLDTADPRVQIAFVNAPDGFRQDWVRNNVKDGVDNAATQLDRLIKDIEDWETMYGDLKPEEEDEPLFSS